MENHVNIRTELNEISQVVASIDPKNTYSVPEGYFATLSDQILLLVQNDPVLQIPNQEVFTVPAGYFDTLPDAVMNRIRKEDSAAIEIETVSPLLASLRNKETYRVPNGYFAALEFEAPVEKPEAKVLKMQPRKTHWMRYAVAASVAGILGITGFFTFKTTKSNEENVVATSSGVEQKMSTVPDDELQDYLFQTTEYPLMSAEGEPQVESALSDLDESEIKDYLKENSTPQSSPTKGI